MRTLPALLCISLIGLFPATSHGGLYYSREQFSELPSQWRGFMLDHRALRSIAIKPSPGNPASPWRERYLAAAARLEKTGKERKLTAEEQADLGAIYVRLGEAVKAVQWLRAAQRGHPNDFAIAANLGTAWQMAGDLRQASMALKDALRLVPGKWQRVEELHWKLVQLRLQKKGLAELEELIGARWEGKDGEYAPGKLARGFEANISEDTVANLQQLALWLPADGPLLWELAELASYYEDFGSAAAMMDGCATQFGMTERRLQLRRQLTRVAADDQRRNLEKLATGEHMGQSVGTLKAYSKRALVAHFDESALPPISAKAVNQLPWGLVAETSVDKKSRPTFPNYLKELDGKLVSITGFMQPVGDELDVSAMMLVEYPVGCWYCEMPEMTQILYVLLPAEKTTPATRQVIRVTGRLALNTTDPEDFFFTIRDAKVQEVD